MSEENDSSVTAISPYRDKSFLYDDQKTVGFTCGAFDLLHAGHALMLAEARQKCDHLIVAVQSDPSIDRPEKNKPVQSYEERLTMVKAIRWVDEVREYDTEEQLRKILLEINPDVRIVGADWKDKEFTGHDLDIDVYFNTRDHGWSTSDLRRRVHSAEEKKLRDERHNEAVQNSTAQLDMLDRYGRNRKGGTSD